MTLLCPTCGGDQFEFDDAAETPELVKCNSCKREITKEDLIELNNENISEHVKEMGQEVVNDLTKDLKRAFSGSKYIKIT